MRIFSRHFRPRKAAMHRPGRLRIEELEPRLLLHIDPLGGEAPPMPADLAALAETNAAGGGSVDSSPFPPLAYSTLADGMPILNSLPAAPGDIFLDFDGDATTGTQAYDVDGDPSTFSATEQSNIAEAWREMSVYYAMFNVNVTTVPPAPGRPTGWIAIGNNIVGNYSGINVFPNAKPESFAENYSATGRESAIAHEIGHNFGNWHTADYDTLGNKTAEYQGEFDPLHGPIMGVDYSGVIHKWTIWHRSLNDTSGQADATVLQDDMAPIAADLAALLAGSDGYRPDDYGGTLATATTLATVGSTQAAVGIIERLTDGDAFSFTSAGGSYDIAVGRDTPSGVDVKVSVYDATGALLAEEDGDPRAQPYTMVNDAELTLTLPAGTYYIIVESHGNYGDQGQYVVRVDPIAANWQAQDVGLAGVPGYASYNGTLNQYTVAGSGSDIWGTSDGFQYLYQTLSGNGTITARVAAMDNTAPWAKAGVMLRESLADNAKEAYLAITPENGVQWSWRSATGGSTGATTPGVGSAFAPRWLRIIRSGNTFTAYAAVDGGPFLQVGSPQTVAMGTTVYVGLVASAVNNTQLNAATFTNVNLGGSLNVGPVLNGFPPPTGLAATSTTSTTANLSWNAAGPLAGDANGDGVVDTVDYEILKSNFFTSGPGDVNGDGIVDLSDFVIIKANLGLTGPTGYSVERSSDGINYTQVGTTAVTAGQFTDTGLSDDQRYFYRVRALGGGGVSTSSGAVTADTRAGAVTNVNVISYSTTQLVLDWTDASGETGYRIERSTDGISGWSTVGSVGKNVPMFVNGGLAANTKYFYRVVTIDAGGDSATSAVASAATRLPAVTGLAFTSKTSTQLTIQWNALAGATSYTVERSTDGTDFSSLATGVATTNYSDTAVTPLSDYYYRVLGVNGTNGAVGAYPTAVFAAAPAAAALPSPWLTQDIGSVGGSGAADFNAGTFTLVGSGSDIWGTGDQFRFVYAPTTGNGTITVRVASMENTDTWAKAGVMIRQSLTSGAKNALMLLRPSEGTYFQYRTSANGQSSNATGPVVAAPYWVRLTRSSSTFTGSVSTDGVTWTTVGSVSISMTGTIYVGLALTAHNNSLLNTATFDSLATTFSGTSAPGGGGGTALATRAGALGASPFSNETPPTSTDAGVNRTFVVNAAVPLRPTNQKLAAVAAPGAREQPGRIAHDYRALVDRVLAAADSDLAPDRTYPLMLEWLFDHGAPSHS
ncbi:MAG: hypothetical protein HYX69_12540 [Planctomycetia bacterium]|nr:hypothetical protein [Planctomycetia bacterium]